MMIEVINPAHPLCCEECGADLADYHMQHFVRRTLIEGACDTGGCSKRHSHQCALKVWAHPNRRAWLEAFGAEHNISVGLFFYDKEDAELGAAK